MAYRSSVESNERITGIDFFKCAAIFGVVVLHTNSGLDVDPAVWLKIRQISKVAVPYFLTASFFLSFQSLSRSDKPFKLWRRVQKLLIPYAFWSLLYLAYNYLVYLKKDDLDVFLIRFLQDPARILFLGGASFHLWFLPLILAGTVAIKLSGSFFRKAKVSTLAVAFGLSTSLYLGLELTQNSFLLNSGIAFSSVLSLFSEGTPNPLIRVIAAYLALMIQCLPYLCFSALLVKAHVFARLKNLKPAWGIGATLIFLLVFVLIHFYSRSFFPDAIAEVITGCVTLLTAVLVSSKLSKHRWVISLSSASYGIYFIHWMVITIFFFLANTVVPVQLSTINTAGLVGVSFLNLIVSWLLIIFLSKSRLFRVVALGSK